MDTFLWILEDVFLIFGLILFVFGLIRIIKRKDKGFLIMLTGIILLLIFYWMADWDALMAIFREGQEAARQ